MPQRGSAPERGAPSPVAEDGGRRPAGRRHRSRLQQPADGHHRLQRLLLDTLAGNEDALEQVQEIKAAGERAASLTQQLLAFSRRQVLQPKVIDLNAIVADFERMLRRTGGRADQGGDRLRSPISGR